MTHKCVTMEEGVQKKLGGGKPLDPGKRRHLMDKMQRTADG